MPQCSCIHHKTVRLCEETESCDPRSDLLQCDQRGNFRRQRHDSTRRAPAPPAPELNPMMHNELCTWCHSWASSSPSCSSCSSHLQQFVEVFDVTFLRLLGWDLRLFEMDVLVVKCLMEDRGWSYWGPEERRSNTELIRCDDIMYYCTLGSELPAEGEVTKTTSCTYTRHLRLPAHLEFHGVLWEVLVGHEGRMLAAPLEQRGEPGLVI